MIKCISDALMWERYVNRIIMERIKLLLVFLEMSSGRMVVDWYLRFQRKALILSLAFIVLVHGLALFLNMCHI